MSHFWNAADMLVYNMTSNFCASLVIRDRLTSAVCVIRSKSKGKNMHYCILSSVSASIYTALVCFGPIQLMTW